MCPFIKSYNKLYYDFIVIKLPLRSLFYAELVLQVNIRHKNLTHDTFSWLDFLLTHQHAGRLTFFFNTSTSTHSSSSATSR